MEDITPLKINMAELQKDIKYIKESLDSHIKKEQETIDRIEGVVKDFLENAKNNFASKLTEKIVYGLVAIILTTFAYGVVRYVIPPQQTLTAQEVQKLIDQNNKQYFK